MGRRTTMLAVLISADAFNLRLRETVTLPSPLEKLYSPSSWQTALLMMSHITLGVRPTA